MNAKENVTLKQYLFAGRFLFLLILILVMLVAVPFIEDYSGLRFVVDIVLSAIFIATLYAISHKKQYLIFALFLIGPTIAGQWVDYFLRVKWSFVMGEICGVLFFGFAIINIINFMRKEKEVTSEVIYAAVVVYLLIAMLWSNVYQLLETLVPGSFSMPEGQIKNDRLLFLYFSIVTITTLGYGDITPLTDRAGGLAAVEAFTGQIYLVVLVAWLVGMHVSRKSK
jgi:voltage-gated potassium channel